MHAINVNSDETNSFFCTTRFRYGRLTHTYACRQDQVLHAIIKVPDCIPKDRKSWCDHIRLTACAHSLPSA